MLVRTVLVCLVLASLSECMFRPQQHHYEECSCEEEVPCEEEPTRPPTTTTVKPTTVPVTTPTTTRTTTRTTVPSTTPTTPTTTTTTVASTTTIKPCGNVRAAVAPYLRKNGYWCSLMVSFGAGSTNYYDYERGREDCLMNNLVVSSLETDQEKAAYIRLAQTTVLYDLTAFWVGASLNTTDHKYYWDDGQAVGLLDPQPRVVDPNGHVAWFLNKNSSVPGYGDFRVVAKTGEGPPKVNGLLCGAPGLQFN
ncbi:hypothetical protein GCK72_007942 [Caenorhabditis remanei]|uniref:C-type lectin domain-containing protein n=1 Tax=Caenorhabditis remanei TaxID=31234 RepID=A0A6A5HLG5_CAERE|nr:hypothetical protein GCK72_007942 [Caenorhabditis remanei]KAF1767981.1 hypothetical protein GCK72_007942 [Caenorhabditis remanei]